MDWRLQQLFVTNTLILCALTTFIPWISPLFMPDATVVSGTRRS